MMLGKRRPKRWTGSAAMVLALAPATAATAQSYAPPQQPQGYAQPASQAYQQPSYPQQGTISTTPARLQAPRPQSSYAAQPQAMQPQSVPPQGQQPMTGYGQQPLFQQPQLQQPQYPSSGQPYPPAASAQAQGGPGNGYAQPMYQAQPGNVPAGYAQPVGGQSGFAAPGNLAPANEIPGQGYAPSSQAVAPAGGYGAAQMSAGVQHAGGPGYAGQGYNIQTGGQVPAAPAGNAAGQTVATTISSAAGTSAPVGGQAADPMAAGAATVPVELNEHLRAATEHPLMPALRWASSELENIRQIRDYSCFFYKRERIDGQLGGHQAMYMKVRHEPFSIYLYFKAPSNLEGQEVLYVKGQNEGKLHARPTGVKRVVGTVSLDPAGSMAMKGNRYPITEAGILNLLDRLVTVGNKDIQYGECDVQFFTSAQGVKVGGRPCTCIQVTHPVPRRNFIFHQARIYIDEELRLPIRYESYDWPTEPGGKPLLMEEYTYQNLKINNGFTDADFDTRNPNYHFE